MSSCAFFTEAELVMFCQQLGKIEDEDYCLEGRGEPLVVIKGQNSWLGLCLTKKEVSFLTEQISMAVLLHEAYQIINT